MILPLTFYDTPLLREKSIKVTSFNSELKELVANMIETMDENRGQGLAAPQVGVLLRLFVVRFYSEDEKGEFHLDEKVTVFVNPKLSNPSSEQWELEEGCLSIPGVLGSVMRPNTIEVEAQNLEGEHFKISLTNPIQSRVVMHENDHLNGVLFCDRMTKKARKKIELSLENLKKKNKK